MTFGFNEGAVVKIINFENKFDDKETTGVSFKLEYGGSFVPIF